MTPGSFEVKAYPEMWKSHVYRGTCLMQKDHPKGMDNCDNVIADIHGSRTARAGSGRAETSPPASVNPALLAIACGRGIDE